MKSRQRVVATLGGACAVIVMLSACGSAPASPADSGSSGTPAKDGSSAAGGSGAGGAAKAISLAVKTDIGTFDPYLSTYNWGENQMMQLAYSTLVQQSPDGKIEPELAEKWTIDGATAVFTIKKDVSCADGDALTADAVARSLQRLNDPATKASQASRVFGVDGADSITADAANSTVTIKLKQPKFDLLEGLAFGGQIICPKGLADPSTLSNGPDGSGLYSMTKAERGSRYDFQLRPTGAAVAEGTDVSQLPAGVALRVMTDDATTANLLLSGELTAGPVGGTQVARLASDKRLTRIEAGANGVINLVWSQRAGRVGADPAFRKAMMAAFDPAAYAAAASGGVWKPASTMITSNQPCYTGE